MVDKPTQLIEYETMLLSRHFTMTTRAKYGDGRLDTGVYVLLTRVQLGGPSSLRQLSETFGLDVSTLNRKTTALVQDGLLERIPDSEGGLARKFRITEEGARRLDHERISMVRGLEKLFDDWTPEDVTAFAAYLQRFNQAIELLAGRPWPRPQPALAPSGE